MHIPVDDNMVPKYTLHNGNRTVIFKKRFHSKCMMFVQPVSHNE
jgi:hypothetical protein